MSPLPHSKPRKRLKAGGPSLRPSVGPCCVQNTESDGERRTWGEESVLTLEMVIKRSLARRVWRKLQFGGRRGAGKGATVGMSNPRRG